MTQTHTLRDGIDRVVPVLGWLTLVGIALVTGLLVLGVAAVALGLALALFLKLLPILLLALLLLVAWRVVEERRERRGP